MPYMEKSYPATDGKSLSRRAGRSEVVLSLARASLPGQMVLRLRRSAERMADLAEDTTAPAPDRISAARAMVALQDQLMDLLAMPRRPAAATGRGKSSIPIDISPATLVGSSPSLPDLD
jgi:hypothetical protein